MAEREALADREEVIHNPRFQRWFSGSQVVDDSGRPRILYHGTNASSFDTFDREDVPDRGGLIAFFASEPRFAQNYGRHVYPVYVRCENPFDFRDTEDARFMVGHFYDEHGGVRDDMEARRIIMGLANTHPEFRDIEDVLDQRYTRADLTEDLFLEAVLQGSWDALEAPEFVEFLRERMDCDGIVLLEQGSVNYGIFDPEQVKSATGNRGTYEPEDPRISANRRGSRATARPPTAFRDLAAWTAWARTQGVELRLAKTPSYTVEITDLFADTTGTGAGTRVMQALAQAADKAGMPLTLHPSSRRNVTFYERFGFGITGRDGMMRREPKRGSRAPTPAPLVLYHGAQRWEGSPEIVAHRKGHAEHGPGIYLTTSYETAGRYAKGGGSVYRIELDSGVRWLQDVRLPYAEMVAWVKGLPRLRGKTELLAGLARVSARSGSTLPGEILVNQFVNADAASGQHGPALAAFLVAHGADASHVRQSGEDWVVVFNPRSIRSVTKVPAKQVGAGFVFDLPRVRE
jgi:hypothetical protein